MWRTGEAESGRRGRRRETVVFRATIVMPQGHGVLSQEDDQNDPGKLFLKHASLGPLQVS